MADSRDSVRVLSLEDPVLSPTAVARLRAALDREPSDHPVLIDCAALRDVTPAGLAALRELGLAGQARAGGPLALSGLSRALTLTALQAELSTAFAIYLSVAAFTQSATERAPAETMSEVACAP